MSLFRYGAMISDWNERNKKHKTVKVGDEEWEAFNDNLSRLPGVKIEGI
jgi:hypothetical protein